MAFFQRLIWKTGRPTEAVMKTRIRQVVLGQWIQVLQIEPEGTVLMQGNYFFQKSVHPARFPIGRQAHKLVLPGINPESAIGSEGRIQEAQRMGKSDLLQGLDRGPGSASNGGRGPLPNPINSQDSRLGKGGREERAGRMRLVVGGEQDGAIVSQFR